MISVYKGGKWGKVLKPIELYEGHSILKLCQGRKEGGGGGRGGVWQPWLWGYGNVYDLKVKVEKWTGLESECMVLTALKISLIGLDWSWKLSLRRKKNGASKLTIWRKMDFKINLRKDN